jgi:thiopurine S-methyltransferase
MVSAAARRGQEIGPRVRLAGYDARVSHDFWHEKWRQGSIGFHEAQPNAYLTRHHAWLAGCRRILAPLCGKAHDLAYLAARGHEVVGVELVEDAVRQFFAEHETTPTIEARDGFAIYAAGPITVLAGDVFATTSELIGGIDGIYDRAALVALPAELRARYVSHLHEIAPRARRTLLISIEYPPGALQGPPFCVDESEVRALFRDAEVRVIDEGLDPRRRANGQMRERCYAIESPPPVGER